tara:strand:+ start:1134 stop:1853 length:720 start_codon:yes stop_codon:yes gene_type:complete
LTEIAPCEFTKETDFFSGELLLINKPLEWTSFDVVKKIRTLIQKKLHLKKIKVGHAGTLDPLASGLLIICTGKFTKRIDEIQSLQKTYIGKIILGASTPSFDRETKVEEVFEIHHITEQLLEEAALKFIGEISQKPPIFSALKKDGERLYKKARRGEKIKLKERKVTIHSFEIDVKKFPEISFKISCSKGTYIRSIANDFGVTLKSGAYLSELCRVEIGDYSLESAFNLQEIEKKIKKQ